MPSYWVIVSSFFNSLPQVCVSLCEYQRFSTTPQLNSSPHWLSPPPLSFSLTLTVSPPPPLALFLASRLESSSPSSPHFFLVLPFFGVGLYHTYLGGFPNPPLLFTTTLRLPLHYFRLPAASGSLFLSSLPPYLVSISRLLYPPCTRRFSLSLGLPPLVALFRGWVWVVIRLLGCPLYPLSFSRLSHQPIMSCYLLPLASALLYTHPHAWVPSLVFSMSFSHCTFFYSSFFFSLDSPPLPFVFGAAHLYFFIRCGGVVRCLLGLFLALLLFPTSIPFLRLLLVSEGFFVYDLLCLFFLRALPVMSLG